MKHTLLITLILIANACQAQYIDSVQYAKMKDHMHDVRVAMNDGGVELQKFTSTHGTGVALTIIGVVASGIGGALSSNGNQGVSIGLVAGGGALALIGTIVELASFSHVRNAGIIFEDACIAIPIKKRKPEPELYEMIK